jgi:hypothetical protein
MKAFLVDAEAWTKLTALEPKPPEHECFGLRIRYDSYFSGIPVIRSPYIISTYDAGYDPLSIIKDFDRWFRVTLFGIEDRKQREKVRRLEQSRDSSAL